MTVRAAGVPVHILDEGVLHRPFGDADVMREQLAHLVAACDLPNVRIQVVPLTAGASCGAAGAFVLASLRTTRIPLTLRYIGRLPKLRVPLVIIRRDVR